MRTFLWIVAVVGLAALCGDTRGATWLALPGLLAAVALCPRGRSRRAVVIHG